LAVLLSAVGCSERAATVTTEAGAFAGRWTNDGPAPLSQMITGLDLRRAGGGYSGTLFLSGRYLEGVGAERDGELSMRFPAGNDTISVRAAPLPDGRLAVVFDPPGSTERITATLTRTR
jgi:hypothetical protein